MKDAAPETRAALVLCGGRSRRMGRDKAWLPFDGQPLLRRVVELLRGTVDEIVAVARPGQALPPLPDDVRVVTDETPDLGPLAGLAGGLEATTADVVYVTACDVPFLQAAVVRRLFRALEGYDAAVVEQEGFLHPLVASYRRTVLGVAKRLVAERRLRPVFLYDEVKTKRIDAETLRDVDPDLLSLANLNTEDAYEEALQRLEALPPRIQVELFEMARQLAGTAVVEVRARTLGEALTALGRLHPALEGEVVESGRLVRHWRASIGGRTFVEDPSTPLDPTRPLIVVSALAGG